MIGAAEEREAMMAVLRAEAAALWWESELSVSYSAIVGAVEVSVYWPSKAEAVEAAHYTVEGGKVEKHWSSL